MASHPDTNKPRTPKAQRFLSHMLKPLPHVLRKRTRQEYDDAPVATMQDLPVQRPACVALQNEDREEDAVVITALTVVPFCCHSDLLTMDRAGLLRVVAALNEKLPRALQLDASSTRPDAAIRRAIERLVGIRTEDGPLPGTPKHVKALPAYARAGDALESPRSPLASKSRVGASTARTNAALMALQEVDEDLPVGPPQKKRRFDPEEFFRESPEPARPPTPPPAVMRSQSDHGVFIAPRARRKARVVRAQSQRNPDARPVLQGIHPNVNATRGRTGSRTVLSAGRPAGEVTTSTPKKRKLAHEAKEGCVPAKQRAPAGPKGTSSAAVAVPAPGQGVTRALKRKLSELSMDETEISFGIEGMTIPAAHSRMEVDPDDVYLY